MRAVVVHQPGGPEVLRLEERQPPAARPGWVLVRVRAFGLNRSELVTRAGGSGDAVRFPRVLGIECVGEVLEAPGSTLRPGVTVLAAMGDMGRAYDGGYQEIALLPDRHVIPVETTLDWTTLGAIPESFGTAWGALEPLDPRPGRTLLVRGGTSSVGMAAITMAKDRGATVLATTRQPAKRAPLERQGADEVLVDEGELGVSARADALLELVGPVTIADSLRALRPGGAATLVGFLEGSWDIGPARAAARRAGVAFTHYTSHEIDRARYGDVFAEIVAGVEDGRYRAVVDATFPLERLADAHRYMEANRATGKVVGLTAPAPAG